MLKTLLESRSSRSGNRIGTVTSAAAHIALIVSALYVTNAQPLPAVVPETATRIYVAPNAPEIAPASTRPTLTEGQRTGVQRPRSLTLDLSIATEIPEITLTPGIDALSDFPERSSGTPGNTASSGAAETGDREAYDGAEVDIPAGALRGGPIPDYPASLRAAGIEGQVVAQFVVDSRGNANASSIRIVSSTNDLFSESVKATIPRMKYSPGRLRGRAIQQTVRQLFVFKLSR